MQLLFIFVDIALNSLASFDGPLIFINLHQIQLEQILIYFKIKSESTGDNIFKLCQVAFQDTYMKLKE